MHALPAAFAPLRTHTLKSALQPPHASIRHAAAAAFAGIPAAFISAKHSDEVTGEIICGETDPAVVAATGEGEGLGALPGPHESSSVVDPEGPSSGAPEQPIDASARDPTAIAANPNRFMFMRG